MAIDQWRSACEVVVRFSKDLRSQGSSVFASPGYRAPVRADHRRGLRPRRQGRARYPRYAYQHRTHLFDITTGNNALTNTPAKVCGDDYMCAAKPGYDAPTGLGTPNGTAGF